MAHHSFTTKQAAAGWKTQTREQLTYWVPEVDIKGTLPKDLVGTFFRNGTFDVFYFPSPLRCTFLQGRVVV
jgi:carotenoid cleavage dioxygenase-like enzyme